jgi:hypothetical protein
VPSLCILPPRFQEQANIYLRGRHPLAYQELLTRKVQSVCGVFARRFWLPQVVKGGVLLPTGKNKRQPQARLPLFFPTAARTQYGLSMVGANGLEPVQNYPFLICGNSTQKRAFGQQVSKGLLDIESVSN